MEGRGEERRVVRAHGKKGQAGEPDVTVYQLFLTAFCQIFAFHRKFEDADHYCLFSSKKMFKSY
jgi:hypothetical protein